VPVVQLEKVHSRVQRLTATVQRTKARELVVTHANISIDEGGHDPASQIEQPEL
jgi:hypothetical protein